MSEHKPFRRYSLGEKYGGDYFTYREAQIALLLVKGYNRKRIAGILSVSLNTVASYIRDMLGKMNCLTIDELNRQYNQ